MAFNAAAAKSPLPATMRHIATVSGQYSDTDGPNFGIAGALKQPRFE
jgi:hypothetical protein